MKSVSDLDNRLKNALSSFSINTNMQFTGHDGIPASEADIQTLARVTYDTLDRFRSELIHYLKS